MSKQKVIFPFWGRHLKIVKTTLLIFAFGVIHLQANVYNESNDSNSDVEIGVLRNAAVKQRVISGTVKDNTGQSLPGVTVIEKGTTRGTVTDVNGEFVLSNISETATLQFSFVGMIMQEIVVGQQTRIDVTMQEETIMIDEVVAVGYGSQKKVNLTGAVSHTDSKTLESRPISSVAQGLQGVIPNLNISQSSGALGMSSSFNVRGFTSINGGGPLILINGVPGDINILNPNDIKEISVLKDAASAAIYGARGAFGVILITTKGGDVSDKVNVSVSSNFSFNRPTVKFEVMDSKERSTFNNIASMRQSGIPYFDEIRQAAMDAHYNDPSKPEVIHHPDFAPERWRPVANIDWPNELMKDSYPMQQHNISISGGKEKVTYYTSFSYLRQEGMAKLFDEKYKRYNFTTDLNFDVFKWLSLGTSARVNNSNKRYLPDTYSGRHPESYNPYWVHSYPEYPIYLPDGRYFATGAVPNMVQFQKEGGFRARDINDSWLTGKAIITPHKDVKINFDYTANIKNTNEISHMRELRGFDSTTDNPVIYPHMTPNRVTRGNRNYVFHIFNAYADYNKSINMHNINVMAGYSQEDATIENFEAYRENLMVETIPFMSLASGNRHTEDGKSKYALRGGFVRFNYNYADRYLIEFNGRYDGTSKFPKDDRFAFFPSLSAAWRIDSEPFFSNLQNTFNVLKIRASYGSLGNQDVQGYYPYVSSYDSGQVNYLLGGEKPMTVYAPGLVSPTLTWETVTQINLGLDFGFLNNRLSGSLDVYRRNTEDMLVASEPLPSVLGVGEPRANAADLKTTGFDFELTWKQPINNGLFSLSLVLSDYISEITKFENPRGLINNYYVGQKIGDIWGLETGGLFQSDEEAQKLDQTQISGRRREAGDIWFKDLDGDGKITRGSQTLDDHGDMKIIGNSTPRYSFGIRPDLVWKNFDFTVFLQGVMKRDVQLNARYFLHHYSSEWNVQPKVGADFWTEDNRNAYFPSPLLKNSADVTTTQSRFLQNAAYMRLKELTIGYSLPKQLTNRIHLSRVRFYFSGYNMLELTDMIKISDPEQSGSMYYPLNRSLSFGFNIDF